MSIEAALVAELKAHAGLAALIGTRIYPLKLPQSATFPAVTYQRISGPRVSCMGGDSLAHPRFQFDCWATGYLDALDVAAQVRAALQRTSGTIGSGSNTASGVAIYLINEIDDYEPDTEYYRVTLDFIVWHEE